MIGASGDIARELDVLELILADWDIFGASKVKYRQPSKLDSWKYQYWQNPYLQICP